MQNTPKYDPQDFDDLSRQIDDLLGTPDERITTADDGIDLAQFTPADSSVEDGAVYQNFSNGYGAGQLPASQGIPAYNRDLHKEKPDHAEYRTTAARRKRPPGRRPRPRKSPARAAAAAAAPRCCCFWRLRWRA